MKIPITIRLLLTATCVWSVAAQTIPGKPEDNGLTPKTETKYINTTLNNSRTESLGVAIAANGNVLVGWEDDGDALSDLEAVWTLVSPSGTFVTPQTTITTIDPNFAGMTLDSTFLSYFRKDGSAVSGRTSWGPKIKANLFGDGIGMGATSFDLGIEVTETAPIQFNAAGENAGDFPSVQLLTNDGQPIGIISGLDDAFAETDGDVRIADWEYLANGNIVIVGESRQKPDLVNKFGGAAEANHAIYRIVDPTGKEIKAVSLVSETPDGNEIWHGVGVTQNGFAVRFNQGGARIRLFDNSGTPISTNINIAEATGNPATGGGGRGDGSGFHGNGKDAYVVVSTGADTNGVNSPWVTVFNENGTVRWSKVANNDVTGKGPSDRVDGAIDQQGRVLVAFDSTLGDPPSPRLVQGRLFEADGKPAGGTFLVSELETPDVVAFESRRARVAWRGNLAAIVWESNNTPDLPGTRVVSVRLFSTFKPGSLESVGLTRIVPDTPIINPGLDALGNWEPYISVLGNSVFLVEGNTFADGSTEWQRYVLALQPVNGGAMKLGEGFFADNGTPYKGQINASRQNGNPGRVAGDKRPGAVNFIVGAEASPHAFTEFTSDNRWSVNEIYTADNRYGTVQIYKLDPATFTQTPLTKAFDAVNGQNTAAFAGNAPEVSRFGGDVAGLDDGNFVVVIDDRSNMIAPKRTATAAIVSPTGQIIKTGFAIDDTVENQIWANVAAFKGGFCARFNATLYFFDNSGTLKGKVAQSTSGEAFDGGRGDGTRIAGHINSPYVFLAGKVAGANLVKVAAFDSRDQKFLTVAIVSEPAFAGDFDRVNLAVDALNRIAVSWVSKPAGYDLQQVAARILAFNESTKTIAPLTASFLPFINNAQTGGIESFQMSVAMTTKQICIAAKGRINLQNKPESGADSPGQINFYTVFSHPDPQDDPTIPVGGPVPTLQTVYNEPAGGWNYILDGSKATAGAAGSGFTSLDGSWSHDNGSDAWDGSAIGGTLGDSNRPGGISSIDGYLRIQDTGDPRDFGFAGDSPIPSNRKIYLGRDISTDGASSSVLNSGVTLHLRVRVPTSGTIDQLYPDGAGAAGPQPYPTTGDGYAIHDGGKGNFGIKQADGGVVSFSLVTDATGAGLAMNSLNGKANSANVDTGEGTANLLPLDPTTWHEFWVVIQADPDGPGTHKVNVYADGELTPKSFTVTAGDGSDFSGISYIALGTGSTGQNGAVDVDYFTYKLGAVVPTSSSLLKLTSITATASQVTLKWSGGKAPYTIQKRANLSGAAWTDVQTVNDTTATLPIEGASGFFRISVNP